MFWKLTLGGAGNIFVFEDKLCTLLCKINLWLGKVEEKLSIVSELNTFADNKDYASVIDQVKHNILSHLGSAPSKVNLLCKS